MPASQKTLRSCTNLGLKTGTLRCAVLATIDHSLFIINFKTKYLKVCKLDLAELEGLAIAFKKDVHRTTNSSAVEKRAKLSKK